MWSDGWTVSRTFARMEVAGVVRPINLGLLQPDLPGIGDSIVIHSGFAMDRIDEATARRSLEFLSSYTEDTSASFGPSGARD